MSEKWHILSFCYLISLVSAMELDKFDRAILKHLQKDGRITNVQLAGAVNLSESDSDSDYARRVTPHAPPILGWNSSRSSKDPSDS